MSIEIYYFSGTGNSMHIAEILHDKLPESVITPVASLLARRDCKTAADTIGFIFPVYYMTIPMPVKHFIKSLNIDSARYIFAIVTRLGTPHNAFDVIGSILRNKGRRLDAYFSLTMAGNDPKYDNYQTPTEDEIRNYENVFRKELERACKIIKEKDSNREKDIGISVPVPKILVTLIPFLNSVFKPIGELFKFKSHFYADNKCIGCGICEKVCLSRKIQMENRKPVWQNGVKCFYCYACLNFCPKMSAQIKGFTEKNGRYSHPYVTADEIARQKVLED